MIARKPRGVRQADSEKLRARIAEYGIELPEGWTLFVTETRGGRCCYDTKTVTVPWGATVNSSSWHKSISKRHDPEYAIWYAAHEVAHAWDGRSAVVHGPSFMAHLKRICPPHLLKYEHDYKPRAAKVLERLTT